MPLFLVGSKCRDPFLRRRTIDLLQSMDRKESAWESKGCAEILRFLQSVEEGSIEGEVTQAEDVSKGRRVSYLCVQVQAKSRKMHAQVFSVATGFVAERWVQL